jgi:hypothetical protein
MSSYLFSWDSKFREQAMRPLVNVPKHIAGPALQLILCNMPQWVFFHAWNSFRVNGILSRICELGLQFVRKKGCFGSPGNTRWKMEAIGIPVVSNLTQ